MPASGLLAGSVGALVKNEMISRTVSSSSILELTTGSAPLNVANSASQRGPARAGCGTGIFLAARARAHAVIGADTDVTAASEEAASNTSAVPGSGGR